MDCIVWILKLLLGWQLLSSLCPYVGYSASHTELCLYVPRMFLTDLGSLEHSYRNETCRCGFPFPYECGFPCSTPAPGKQTLRKELEEPPFLQDGNHISQDWGKVNLLRTRRGSKPACVWKPLFARNGLASPEEDLQICSEDRNSRGRVEAPDCPLPALQRYS